MPDPAPIEIHKALADDTRYRLYRYLRLSGRPVVDPRALHTSVAAPEHPASPSATARGGRTRRRARSTVGATVGRPQILYTAVAREEREGRDYRLLGEILAGLIAGKRQLERAETVAREWGAYLVGRSVPRPGARGPPAPTSRSSRRRSPRPGSIPGSDGAARRRSRSRSVTAPSATCSTSIGSWSAPCTEGSWRACWVRRDPRSA